MEAEERMHRVPDFERNKAFERPSAHEFEDEVRPIFQQYMVEVGKLQDAYHHGTHGTPTLLAIEAGPMHKLSTGSRCLARGTQRSFAVWLSQCNPTKR